MKLPILFTFIATVITVRGENFKVYAVTWNVHETSPPTDLSVLLGQTQRDKPDIIIVGLQEISLCRSYFCLDEWSSAMKNYLSSRGYSSVSTVTLGGIKLNVYMENGHTQNHSNLVVKRVMTGFYGFFLNKGGVIMKFDLYNQTYCIVNSHFHAHDKDLDKRINDYWTIERKRQQVCGSTPDYTFWLGDMNFRIGHIDQLNAQNIYNDFTSGRMAQLLAWDQLQTERNSVHHPRIFENYQEQHITFKPTYKMTPGGRTYDLNRRPAWTDRILYKVNSRLNIRPLQYKSIKTYTQSDHFPVRAQFKIDVATRHN